MSNISFFTDGGSRGNPGPSAYGFVIKNSGEVIHEEGKTIGITTNNVAEYTAVLSALEWFVSNPDKIKEAKTIRAFMDSLLLCQQLKGVYKIKKPHLAAIMHKIREKEHELNIPIIYSHIPRELNKEADKLVNIALDSAV
jgi:ribonuclease HI